eukprot:TRINITY_DN2364_c1_g1_i1.p1 TRINITY_DN2364_c1_g1~~TRINITY_DN2364_c1_g1_i1.p1  ORF type:complete len:488 (-),score=30.17 TRINITY_DN2364_c1_g1_i1:138-1601(-)
MGWQCHPIIIALQLQGVVIFLLFFLGWTWAGWQRRKALKEWPQLLAKNQVRIQQQNIPPNAHSPALTVIMPIKSCREGSIDNWRSHLRIQYSGPVEFIFVAGSERDSAFSAVQELLSQENYQNAQLIVAEPSMNCSQKVQNLVTGVRHANSDSKYVLFLDDDIRLAPGFVQALIDRKEADGSQSFMSTAYPFDIPDMHANLLTYAVLVFHLPLLIGISFKEHSFFVWGGCMLLPLADLQQGDKYGILEGWENGGYSDDLIVAGKCSLHKQHVLCSSFAVLPQRLGQKVTWKQYWNYLRRQLYVLDTYSDPHNRSVNSTMMFFLVYLSWAFAISVVLTICQLVICFVGLIVYVICQQNPSLISFGYDCTFEQSSNECRISMCPVDCQGCVIGKVSIILILTMAIFAHVALMNFVQVILKVLKRQDEVGCRDLCVKNFNWVKLWLGMLFTYTLVPFCMMYTLCINDIEWSGITYRKHKGKVHRVASRHF